MSTYTLSRRLFSAVYAAGATSGTPGTALANGKLWLTVEGGTYNNSADYMPAYTDSTSGTAVTRDGEGAIVLDAAGETEIWYEGLADIRVASSTDELQYTQDSVPHAMPNVVTGSSNILPNGSFEQDSNADGTPDDWSLTPLTGGAIAIDGTVGNSSHGENGLKFTGVGSGGGWADSAYFPVSNVGKPLRVQWEFKQSTAPTGSYTIEIFWYKDDDGTASATASTLIWNNTSGAPTSFTQYGGNADVPSDAVWARLRATGLGAAGADKSGDCWYDNIRVFQDNGGFDYGSRVTLAGTSTQSGTIPEWAKEINVFIENVSTNSTSPVYLRFIDGDGSTLTTNTGGASQVTGTNTTTINAFAGTGGIPIMISNNLAANTRHGRATLTVMNPGTETLYAGDMVMSDSTGDVVTAAWTSAMSTAHITKVELQSADTFDSGTFIVTWKG
jgi:hypothetical protein